MLRTETQIAGTLTRAALFGADDMPTADDPARLRDPAVVGVRGPAPAATRARTRLPRVG